MKGAIAMLLFSIMLTIHIIAGFSALIVFWVDLRVELALPQEIQDSESEETECLKEFSIIVTIRQFLMGLSIDKQQEMMRKTCLHLYTCGKNRLTKIVTHNCPQTYAQTL
ncbi:hypothetical protein [Halobacillus trueperi]|uniref:hypothetical protein n=1 Tax=Halobacillus trueperi TaxID=156205 RepID=UPI00373586CF